MASKDPASTVERQLETFAKRGKRAQKAVDDALAAAIPTLRGALELVETGSLKPLEGNARSHSPRQLDALARSIRAFGFVAPVLADAGGTILAGHARVEAAKRVGLERVPVMRVEHLSADQARAYAIADNRLAELADWDEELLARELRALEGAGRELADVGFTARELAELERELAPSAPAVAEDEGGQREIDTGPAVARKGDLWTLGRHRFLVGDGRRPADLERLCAGPVPRLLVTDPPYCSGGFQEAGRAAGTWGEIASDNLSTKGYEALIRGALEAAEPRAVYVFTDWRMWETLHALVEDAGIAARSMIVWDKGTPGLGNLWRTQHELVLFGSRVRARRIKGVPAEGNVLRFRRSGNGLHYTEKPVELLEAILRGHSAAEKVDRVLDPFAGSGPILLAAERRDVTAFCCDVEPKSADAALTRWRRAGMPEPWLEAKGRPTWSSVARERGIALDGPSEPRPPEKKP